VLLSLAVLALAGGLPLYFGLLGWAFRAVGFVVTRTTQRGFQVWERLLSWASWPLFLAIAITLLLVGGFAMLNQGLYETVGSDWFQVRGEQGAGYADFLAYALINLLRIVDVLNLAEGQHFPRAAYVHPERWPASLLLAGFRVFFTFCCSATVTRPFVTPPTRGLAPLGHAALEPPNKIVQDGGHGWHGVVALRRPLLQLGHLRQL
jgi:hypothetical protein